MFINGNCVCNAGYMMMNDVCRKQCPANSADNGLGQCVCNPGYFRGNDGSCISGT